MIWSNAYAKHTNSNLNFHLQKLGCCVTLMLMVIWDKSLFVDSWNEKQAYGHEINTIQFSITKKKQILTFNVQTQAPGVLSLRTAKVFWKCNLKKERCEIIKTRLDLHKWFRVVSYVLTPFCCDICLLCGFNRSVSVWHFLYVLNRFWLEMVILKNRPENFESSRETGNHIL